MYKVAFILLLLPMGCRTSSKLYFENKELEQQVKGYLKDLKKEQPEIISVVVESYKENDSVFITLSNAYPDITKVKAYTVYRHIDFCFTGTYPLTGYYKIDSPSSAPVHLEKAYQEIKEGKRLGYYEPYTRSLIFYDGRTVKEPEIP